MILEAMCKIEAFFKKTPSLTVTVPNAVDSINTALNEMGLTNTTGLTPTDSKEFENQMKKLYKELKFLVLTDLAIDTETGDIYILTKEGDLNVRDAIKKVRRQKIQQNKKSF